MYKDKLISLTDTVLYSTIGVLAYSLSQWVFVFYLVKKNALIDVGHITYNQAIIAPWAIMALFSLRPIFISDIKNRLPFNTFFSLRLSCTFLFIIVFSVLALKTKNLFLFLSALNKAIDLFNDIVIAFFQKQGQTRYVGNSFLMKSFFSTISFIVIYTLFEDLNLAYFSVVLMNGLVFLFHDINFFFSNTLIKLDTVFQNYIILLKSVIPITISATIHTFNLNYPRIILNNTIGKVEIAVFGAFYYFNISILLLFSSLADNYISSFIKNEDEKKNKIFRLIFLWIIIFFSMFIILFHFLDELIIKTIYSNYFLTYISLFKFTIFLAFLEVVNKLYSYRILLDKNLTFQLIVFLLSIFITYFFSNSLILVFKIQGLYYTLIINSLFQLVCYSLFYFVKFKYEKKY